MLLDPIKHLSNNLDKGDMNALKANYIQIGKVLHVGLLSNV